MPDLNIAGKVVAVTGAAGRLGEQVVQQFARHGAAIAAFVRDEAAAARLSTWHFEGQVFTADLSDEAAVAAGFRQVEQRFGRLDVLVHTVGAWAGGPFLETSLEAWRRLMDTNLTSAFLCFREAARLMQGRGGRLIGIASGQGADQGRAEQAAYSAAKAGVVRLVEAVAAELEGQGVTAHAIAPSTIRYGREGEEGVPAETIADLCLYLCSPAGDALSGATLRAYGRFR